MNSTVPFPLLQNTLTVLGGKLSMSLHEILRSEGDGNYTRFVLTNSTHVITSKSLKYYEEGLTKASFVRIGKSCIVNRGHIVKIKKIN